MNLIRFLVRFGRFYKLHKLRAELVEAGLRKIKSNNEEEIKSLAKLEHDLIVRILLLKKKLGIPKKAKE